MHSAHFNHVELAALALCQARADQSSRSAQLPCKTPCDLCMRTVTEAIHMICSASEQQGPIKLSVDEQRLFLDHIMCKARQGDVVTPEEVDLLCNLAGWHMMPPPHNWNGTLEIQETERAVAEAKAAMSV